MKWTWDKFGFWDKFGYNEPRPDPTDKLQAILREYLPEELSGKVRAVAMCREPGCAMLIAVESSLGNATEPISLPPEMLRQVQREYGNNTLHVIRWSDDPETLIRNALHATEVDKVLLCEMIGRAIVLVQEHQRSQAIGPGGLNIRLASKVCHWDIEIMTANELELQIRRAKQGFHELEGVSDELAANLVEHGFLSYDDLSVIDPDNLMQIGGLTAEQANSIVEQADAKAVNDLE